jgi:hypothetical protein
MINSTGKRYSPIRLVFGILFTFTTALLAQTERDSLNAKLQTAMQNIDSVAPAPKLVIKRKLDRVVPNKAFHVGEKLTFNIKYGFIRAGEAKMHVAEEVQIDSLHRAYRIITTARSASFFDNFYKVRDSVETWLDTRGIFSWKYEKRLREGGYKFDLLVKYDQIHGKAYVKRIRYHNTDEPLKIKNQSEFELDIPPYVLDVLGAFYYVRTQKLEPGMPLYMTNHDNKKIYDLQVLIQKREKVSVDAGTFRCILIKPILLGESIFKQEGELWVWLTDDQYKIPVKMQSKVAVGSITTELKSIEGIALPLPSQLK